MRYWLTILILMVMAGLITGLVRMADADSITIGSYGDIHWRNPVDSVALLPASSNCIDDARVVGGTSIYIWNGSAWAAATAVAGTPGATGATGATGSYAGGQGINVIGGVISLSNPV